MEQFLHRNEAYLVRGSFIAPSDPAVEELLSTKRRLTVERESTEEQASSKLDCCSSLITLSSLLSSPVRSPVQLRKVEEEYEHRVKRESAVRKHMIILKLPLKRKVASEEFLNENDLCENPLYDGTDAYTPRYVKGVGARKQGLCLYCDAILNIKTSSYLKHMRSKHGILAKSKKEVPNIKSSRTSSGNQVDVKCRCGKWMAMNTKERPWLKYYYSHCSNKH